MMYPRTATLLLAITLAGCGGESAADKGTRRARTPAKDRGQASMALGSWQWQADSAKAKLDDGRLTIRAAQTEMTDGKVKRQELHLLVADFLGPGDYETAMSGSRFLAVGMDVDAAKAAGDEDAAAATTAADLLSKAQHMMLSGALVKVTAASDTEISGTFSWQPPAGLDQPAITNGTFRALVDR